MYNIPRKEFFIANSTEGVHGHVLESCRLFLRTLETLTQDDFSETRYTTIQVSPQDDIYSRGWRVCFNAHLLMRHIHIGDNNVGLKIL